MAEICFKSYCWSIGTTSYRTDKMNLSIERQIQLMNEFRNLPENMGIEWRSLQDKYYRFLQINEFVKGDAPRPDKDAREKTSGLVDIGLLTKDRELTEAGTALLEICKNGNFASNNLLEIDKDSFIYLKQLIKTSISVDKKQIRPFIILVYLLSKFKYLTKDEFTYFLPMCIDETSTQRIITSIEHFRQGNLNITEALYEVISSMDNYKAALKFFIDSEVLTSEIICTVGFNRKSSGEGQAYDTAFFSIFNCLKDIYLDKHERTFDLFNLVGRIKGNTRLLWKKLLFGKNQFAHVKKKGVKALANNTFSTCKNIVDFKKEFFKVLHSFKVQVTLRDYSDLNKRYFKLTDCVLFRDSKVEFDILPKSLFNLVSKELFCQAFSESTKLNEDVSLIEICSSFETAEKQLYAELSNELGVSISDSLQAHKFVYDDRYARFNKLIDDKFNSNNLILLLEKFETRNDSEISGYITDNADIPTLFEYILGIAWYSVSERKGDILSYMNLSLDAELLPKTHAGGGMADIVYEYDKTEFYPEHTLLIEATLSEKAGQRSMEIEPVTRHLGEYLANHNTEAYTLFMPTYLNPNIVTDFRMRKDFPYIANNGKEIDGMKIIPLQTSELKTILQKGEKYKDVYPIFEKAFLSTENVRNWYQNAITKRL